MNWATRFRFIDGDPRDCRCTDRYSGRHEADLLHPVRHHAGSSRRESVRRVLAHIGAHLAGNLTLNDARRRLPGRPLPGYLLKNWKRQDLHRTAPSAAKGAGAICWRAGVRWRRRMPSAADERIGAGPTTGRRQPDRLSRAPPRPCRRAPDAAAGAGSDLGAAGNRPRIAYRLVAGQAARA